MGGEFTGGAVLKSLDGETSPVSVARGPGGTVEVSMFMSPEGFELLGGLADEAGVGLEDVIARSLILYRAAKDAERRGMTAGAASNPEGLDVRFVDL